MPTTTLAGGVSEAPSTPTTNEPAAMSEFMAAAATTDFGIGTFRLGTSQRSWQEGGINLHTVAKIDAIKFAI